MFLLTMTACTQVVEAPAVEQTAAPGPAPEPRPVTGPWQYYLEAQVALSQDDLNAARGSLVQLAESGDGEVIDLAREAAEAADLAAARSAFGALSETMVREQAIPDGHQMVHCPMANEGEGANWIQAKGEIRNPYFGAAMISCGTPVETSQ